MNRTLTEGQRRLLKAIFELGSEHASQALSQWLDQHVRLTVSEVEQVNLAEATGLLGPEDELVAACAMELAGALTGHLLLVFEDRAGLVLADWLLRQPPGTATTWGELERSAALETANIVGCAFLNSLAGHLPTRPGPDHDPGPLVPSPPKFRHEFAASLLEFALMDQATLSDRLLVVRSRFGSDQGELSWCLLFIPSAESLRTLSRALVEIESC